VTGASFTSIAFEKSLQGAITKFRQTAAKKATELGTTVPVISCKPMANGDKECLGAPTGIRYGVLRLRVSFVSG